MATHHVQLAHKLSQATRWELIMGNLLTTGCKLMHHGQLAVKSPLATLNVTSQFSLSYSMSLNGILIGTYECFCWVLQQCRAHGASHVKDNFLHTFSSQADYSQNMLENYLNVNGEDTAWWFRWVLIWSFTDTWLVKRRRLQGYLGNKLKRDYLYCPRMTSPVSLLTKKRWKKRCPYNVSVR